MPTLEGDNGKRYELGRLTLLSSNRKKRQWSRTPKGEKEKGRCNNLALDREFNSELQENVQQTNGAPPEITKKEKQALTKDRPLSAQGRRKNGGSRRVKGYAYKGGFKEN